MDLIFSKCDENNFHDFYILKCDEGNIYWTGHKNAPAKEKLKRWYLDQLTRDDRIMFIVKSDEYCDEPIGYLYLDITGSDKDVIETGHGVNSKFKGAGIGTRIIKFAIDYTTSNLRFINRIDGWIASVNIGSIKNVLKNGYSESNETKKMFFEGFNKDVIMRKYFYTIVR